MSRNLPEMKGVFDSNKKRKVVEESDESDSDLLAMMKQRDEAGHELPDIRLMEWYVKEPSGWHVMVNEEDDQRREKEENKYLQLKDSIPETFYTILLEAGIIIRSIKKEELLHDVLVENLRCLGRSQTFTKLLVGHFNRMFPQINKKLAMLEEALLVDPVVESIDGIITMDDIICKMCGGPKMKLEVEKMLLASRNNNIEGTKLALQELKKAYKCLFDKLQAYFKLGVKLGLPEDDIILQWT